MNESSKAPQPHSYNRAQMRERIWNSRPGTPEADMPAIPDFVIDKEPRWLAETVEQFVDEALARDLGKFLQAEQ